MRWSVTVSADFQVEGVEGPVTENWRYYVEAGPSPAEAMEAAKCKWDERPGNEPLDTAQRITITLVREPLDETESEVLGALAEAGPEGLSTQEIADAVNRRRN